MTFEERTATTLRDCARWMDEHADELARGFCRDMGCESWSVRFDADTCGTNAVIVHTTSRKLGLIDYRRD